MKSQCFVIELGGNNQSNIGSNEQKDKEWLQHNVDPWTTVKEKWSSTFPLRRSEIISMTFDDILENQWPRFKKKEGFELVDIDFQFLYPNNVNNFKRLWGRKYIEEILKLAIKTAEDKKDKESAKKFSCTVEDEENNFNSVLALNALFYLLPNRNKTQKQNLDYLLRKAPKGAKIDLEIKRISEIAAARKEDMDPFIQYFENENGIPYKFFVCINQQIYETLHFTTAMDIVFKSYYVFQMEYPPQCVVVLTFIQHFFYQIFLDEDVNYPLILSVMCDLDIDRGLECEEMMNNAEFDRKEEKRN